MSVVTPNPAEPQRVNLPLLREAAELIIERFEEEYSLAPLVDANLTVAMTRILIQARAANISAFTEILEWDPIYRAMYESDNGLRMVIENLTYYLASWNIDTHALVNSLVNMIVFQQTNSFNDSEDRRVATPAHWKEFLSQNSWACIFILLKIGRIPQYTVYTTEPASNADTDTSTE